MDFLFTLALSHTYTISGFVHVGRIANVSMITNSDYIMIYSACSTKTRTIVTT
jgi:hypothetical protein